jgi:hypothetical protein
VQFTRNVDGIVGALKKVGGLIKNGRLDSPHAETASHLYFANCRHDPWLPFLSSHPPLLRRIRLLEPDFDGQYPVVRLLAPTQVERERQYETALGFALQLDHVGQTPSSPAAEQQTLQRLREVGIIHLNIPPEIAAATRTVSGAVALVSALLTDPDEPLRAEQLNLLRRSLPGPGYEELVKLLPSVEAMEGSSRLPVIELSIPSLRLLDPGALEAFLKTVQALAEADGAIDLFEYALLRILRYRLTPARPGGTFSSLVRYSSAKSLVKECQILLSALAWLGRDEESKAAATFREGSQYLDVIGVDLALLPRDQCGLEQVDQALSRVTTAAAHVKRNLLLACARAVAADRKAEVREMELLRAIADTLECPMPRFVEGMAEV